MLTVYLTAKAIPCQPTSSTLFWIFWNKFYCVYLNQVLFHWGNSHICTISICVCVFVLRPLLLFSSRGGRCLYWKQRKQPPRGVPRKRCSENMQKIYRRTPCRSTISIKLQSNFIEIRLRHGCSPVNLLHIFRTPFLEDTSGWLLLKISRIRPHRLYNLGQFTHFALYTHRAKKN